MMNNFINQDQINPCVYYWYPVPQITNQMFPILNVNQQYNNQIQYIQDNHPNLQCLNLINFFYNRNNQNIPNSFQFNFGNTYHQVNYNLGKEQNNLFQNNNLSLFQNKNTVDFNYNNNCQNKFSLNNIQFIQTNNINNVNHISNVNNISLLNQTNNIKNETKVRKEENSIPIEIVKNDNLLNKKREIKNEINNEIKKENIEKIINEKENKIILKEENSKIEKEKNNIKVKKIRNRRKKKNKNQNKKNPINKNSKLQKKNRIKKTQNEKNNSKTTINMNLRKRKTNNSNNNNIDKENENKNENSKNINIKEDNDIESELYKDLDKHLNDSFFDFVNNKKHTKKYRELNYISTKNPEEFMTMNFYKKMKEKFIPRTKNNIKICDIIPKFNTHSINNEDKVFCSYNYKQFIKVNKELKVNDVLNNIEKIWPKNLIDYFDDRVLNFISLCNYNVDLAVEHIKNKTREFLYYCEEINRQNINNESIVKIINPLINTKQEKEKNKKN